MAYVVGFIVVSSVREGVLGGTYVVVPLAGTLTLPPGGSPANFDIYPSFGHTQIDYLLYTISYYHNRIRQMQFGHSV